MLESEEFIHEMQQLKEYENIRPTFLTQKQAENRGAQTVKGTIHYNLQLRLDKGDHYKGIVEVEFNVSHVQSDIFIDYQGSSIEKILINNTLIPQTNKTYLHQVWNGLFLTVPLYYCNNGRNTLVIEFSNKYTNDGLGLHSFTDADSLQYIYSNNEPFWCNRIFPTFDQPDLKATLQVSIVSPQDWVILSNELKEHEGHFSSNSYKNANPNAKLLSDIFGDIKDGQNNYHYAVFKKTPLQPTYLYCFAAGPYYEVKHKNAAEKDIPMSIFCRKSLAPHLDKMAEWLFEANVQSIKLFEQFFDYPYPYSKLDSVFCPEYHYGAMENIGLITYNDDFLFREEQTAKSYTYFLNIIIHEISHQWFGNLVTMKWWNDLWLNESFAEFISHFIQSKMTVNNQYPQCNVWVLYNDTKIWGYQTDQKITTHPIAGIVENTEAAETIFDGISYSKGSAVLRQLMCLMGEKPFSDALKKYFKKFAYKNAVLQDLIDCLDVECKKLNLGFTLHDWQKSWIQTAGLNSCVPVFNPEDRSNHAKLKIIQSAVLSQHPTLRRHKIQVAFFDENANITNVPVLLNDYSETILTYDASKTEYQAVLLNYGDWGYIKVALDEISLQFFKKNINKIKDEVTRIIIWGAFYDMVRDGVLSSEEFTDIFINIIPNETSDDIIINQLEYLMLAFSRFTPQKFKLALGERIFNFLIKYLLNIPKENKNRIIGVRDWLDSFARSDAHIAKLLHWFKGEDADLKNIEIGLAGQWRIVALIHKSKKYTRAEKLALFKIQAERDPTDTSQNYEHMTKALDVNEGERETLWQYYLSSSNKLSVKSLQYSWQGFNSTFNQAELDPYFDKFFHVIQNVFETKPKEFSREFFSYLFPETKDFKKLLVNLEQLLSALNENQVAFKLLIRESIDDVHRQEKAHACFMQRAPLAKHH